MSRTGNLETYLRCKGFKVAMVLLVSELCGDATEDDADKLASNVFMKISSNQVPQDSFGNYC